ncbi:LuxR C-terminal-related transcriptional regulator [Nonomuraea sp. LP-02]|uniref:LuxR C-terminal-related transcriptional regulator n=1 Tax=Nonomuraea sp. LP-02 TaxID=3097960 RepID=UPI002E37F2EE|nr:LuxR C-terminal-related transcriptional regulator [Nonomuraea sp. LP-02]MED7930132.1 LuxR C-terminal-related transcriptional regulator [Nonomuraea sp. LP-02]
MPEPPRHNLPAEPNRFVGRERDLDDLRGLFGRTRVVTLCGVGGIGKTRLALRVAAGLTGAYPDGVWLVELARLGRGELVVPEIARVLGVRAETGRPLLDTVTARLRDLRCLLLLDNCEHLVDACAEVTAGLVAACPRLSVLATSREPLRIASELIWRVPPLDLPDPDPTLDPALDPGPVLGLDPGPVLRLDSAAALTAPARPYGPAALPPARPLPEQQPGSAAAGGRGQAPPGKAPPEGAGTAADDGGWLGGGGPVGGGPGEAAHGGEAADGAERDVGGGGTRSGAGTSGGEVLGVGESAARGAMGAGGGAAGGVLGADGGSAHGVMSAAGGAGRELWGAGGGAADGVLGAGGGAAREVQGGGGAAGRVVSLGGGEAARGGEAAGGLERDVGGGTRGGVRTPGGGVLGAGESTAREVESGGSVARGADGGGSAAGGVLGAGGGEAARGGGFAGGAERDVGGETRSGAGNLGGEVVGVGGSVARGVESGGSAGRRGLGADGCAADGVLDADGTVVGGVMGAGGGVTCGVVGVGGAVARGAVGPDAAHELLGAGGGEAARGGEFAGGAERHVGGGTRSGAGIPGGEVLGVGGSAALGVEGGGGAAGGVVGGGSAYEVLGADAAGGVLGVAGGVVGVGEGAAGGVGDEQGGVVRWGDGGEEEKEGDWGRWGGVVEVESVQLFLDRAAAVGTRLGPESIADVVRLCRALDGLPLALELAAARTSLLSPGQIADRIDDRFSLLTTGGRTAPARQRTLLAAVEWSYDLLSYKEQVVLRRLAVFAGGFDLGLAERVCAVRPVAEAEIVDLLGGLVDKSLVLCDENRTRYRLLETIKRYALERLRQAGERELLRERHLGVMCELQERLFATEMVDPGVPWPERLRALTASRSLLDDQRAALDWAVESGDVALGLRLCTVSTALLPLGGNPAEIVDWIERLLSLDVSAVSPEQVAHAKAYLAYGLEARDELSRSLEAAEESLAGLAPDNVFPRCVMHSLVVVVLLRMGRVDEAVRHAEEGLAAATRTGDPWNQAAGLAGLSAVALTRGRLREAQRHGEEALARAREHGHRWIMARAAAQLGAVAEVRGDLVTAKARYEMAVPWLRELGADGDLARCLAHGGRVAAMLGEFAVARRRLAASLALSRETGQRQGVARCLMGLSVLAECEGDLEGALPAAAAAAALRESIGQQHATLRIEELLGRARARLGEGRTAALWSRGRVMGPDDAARRVLEGERQPRREPPVPVEPVRRPLLTAREQEIAGLLTRGLSNRAIAGELVISPATVARHIANIMEKLGYTSRAQIAVWAAEQASGPSA